jgi:hypothetical protein
MILPKMFDARNGDPPCQSKIVSVPSSRSRRRIDVKRVIDAIAQNHALRPQVARLGGARTHVGDIPPRLGDSRSTTADRAATLIATKGSE